MKKSMKSRQVYTPPTFEVLFLQESAPLLAGSPPQTNPGGGNVSVVAPKEEDGEELSGAKKWSFWEEDAFQ